MKTLLKNAKIVTTEAVLTGSVCVIEDGIISYVGKEYSADFDAIIDADGGYLVPGFIDIHCHGGNNYDFMDATAEEPR